MPAGASIRPRSSPIGAVLAQREPFSSLEPPNISRKKCSHQAENWKHWTIVSPGVAGPARPRGAWYRSVRIAWCPGSGGAEGSGPTLGGDRHQRRRHGRSQVVGAPLCGAVRCWSVCNTVYICGVLRCVACAVIVSRLFRRFWPWFFLPTVWQASWWPSGGNASSWGGAGRR